MVSSDPPGIDLAALTANGYNPLVATQRPTEYPQLTTCTYLDHASCTLSPTSAICAFSADLTMNLYSNPHSASPASLATTALIETVRHRVLAFLSLPPSDFTLVFTANATASLKLIAESFSSLPGGFSYAYHIDAHTSLVGIRAAATTTHCFHSEASLSTCHLAEGTSLIAWPAQSNFSGHRPPSFTDHRSKPRTYTLLDAAALLTTAPLNLTPETAPDFIALSFHKIFGFPDLGALIVRRESTRILRHRPYFGGGTVESLAATEGFVRRKTGDANEWLEDGTLPFHSIVALKASLDAYERLYTSPSRVGAHAFALAQIADQHLRRLQHYNGQKVCEFYSAPLETATTQGPILCFNVRRASGEWVGYTAAESEFAARNVHIRVGGMCNPGGIEKLVGVEAEEIKRNWEAGHKCSDGMDVIDGQPTGAVRVSFGGMSTLEDVHVLLRVVGECWVERGRSKMALSNGATATPFAGVDGEIRTPESLGGRKMRMGYAVSATAMQDGKGRAVRESTRMRLRKVLSSLRRGNFALSEKADVIPV